MCTRLHALGFPCEWTRSSAEIIERLAVSGSRRVPCRDGEYRVWRTAGGAELWFHFPPRKGDDGRLKTADPGNFDHLVAITPFHRGRGSIPIRVGRMLALDRGNPLEGSCLAWLPSQSKSGRGQAMVLELVPFALHRVREPPFSTSAQIVCFAHAVWAHATVEDYLGSTPSNRRLSPGSFSPVTEADVPEVKLTYRYSPVTLGLVTGIVRQSIRLTNPATDAIYYWLALETRRGTFDVIANPAQVTGDISDGHVVQVCGSFVGRLAGTKV